MSGAGDTPLLILVPTRGRAARLAGLIGDFRRFTPPCYDVLFVADPDDDATWEALEPFARTEVQVLEHAGTYPQKVNAGIAVTEHPMILVGADDIRPYSGWLEAASDRFSDTVGLVALNDLGNEEVQRGELATLPLVARWYVYEIGGTLYHEGYHHNGADRDASELAKQRGAFAYAPDAVVEHLHPNYGKAEADETYERGGMNRLNSLRDMELFRSRWGAV